MKQRIQVTLNPELVEEARKLMVARKFDSLSEFLEALIREEWESHKKYPAPKEEPPLQFVDRPAGDCALNENPIRADKVDAAVAAGVEYILKPRKPRKTA